MLNDIRIRRLIVGCLAVFIVIVGATQLYRYLTTGKLSVTTNRKDSYIRVVGDDGQKIGGSKQSKDLGVRLKPGRYTVMVNAGSAYTNKVVTVALRKKTAVGLQLSTPQTLPSPVLGQAVTSVAVSSDSLYFIEPSTGDLEKIDGQGNVTTISDTYVYRKARWTSPGMGAVMDDNRNLYTVNNGAVTPLSLPFPINNNPSIDFDLAPNGALYVSNGQDVYAGNLSGNFTKIYSSGKAYNSGIAAGTNGVAFIEKNSQDNSTSIVVVHGGEQKRTDTDATQLVWSPDGTHLAGGGSKNNGTIYNQDLSVARVLPNQGVAHSVWQSAGSLLYSVGNVVWSYNLSGQESKAIASLPANQSIAGGVISSDGGYLYFSGNTQLFRLALKNQKVDRTLVALGAFLPESIGVCSLNYVNFTRPVITIQYPHLEGSATVCLRVAQAQVQHFGLITSKFQYVFTQPSDFVPSGSQ